MRRRGFLATVGAAALAGCSGVGTGGGSPAGSGPSSGSPSGGDAGPTATPTRAGPPAGGGPGPPHKGVSLSPQSYASADFARFLDRAAEAGTALRWAGDWAELGDDEGAPAVVASVAGERGLATVVDVGVFSADRRALFRPLTPATRRAYVEDAASFAAAHAPDYLGLGVEVNLHREADPDSFEAFVDLFAEAAAAVGDASPGTTVSVTFQYEHLRGLRGGLFGGEHDPDAAAWDLLDRFPDADQVGLTTYPGLVHRDPGEVPDDYFDAIAARTDRPVAITETGWTAETVAEGWESDPAEQAAYVRRLFDLLDGLDPALLLWLHLYDQPSPVAAFEGMGLRAADGTARPAWDAWLEGAL